MCHGFHELPGHLKTYMHRMLFSVFWRALDKITMMITRQTLSIYCAWSAVLCPSHMSILLVALPGQNLSLLDLGCKWQIHSQEPMGLIESPGPGAGHQRTGVSSPHSLEENQQHHSGHLKPEVWPLKALVHLHPRWYPLLTVPSFPTTSPLPCLWNCLVSKDQLQLPLLSDAL